MKNFQWVWVVLSNDCNNGCGGWVYHTPKLIKSLEDLEDLHVNTQGNSMCGIKEFPNLLEAWNYRIKMSTVTAVFSGHIIGTELDYYGQADVASKLEEDFLDDVELKVQDMDDPEQENIWSLIHSSSGINVAMAMLGMPQLISYDQ